jgi:hypothetical protein
MTSDFAEDIARPIEEKKTPIDKQAVWTSPRVNLGSFRIVEHLMCVFAGDYEKVEHLNWKQSLKNNFFFCYLYIQSSGNTEKSQ